MYPCIILCGGLATRLGKIASETPKCLLKVNDKPFLYYQLKLLEESGMKQVFLSVGHLSNKFYEFIESYSFKKMSIKLVEDGSSPLGTGGAVKNIIKELDSPSFVMYGDSFLRVSFVEIYNAYNLNEGPLITIFKNNNKFDKSNIYFEGDDIIYNKSTPKKSCNYIDYGVGVYDYSHFKDTSISFDLSLIQEKYSNQKKLQYFIAQNRFIEIGTPSSYKRAESFFSNYED